MWVILYPEIKVDKLCLAFQYCKMRYAFVLSVGVTIKDAKNWMKWWQIICCFDP